MTSIIKVSEVIFRDDLYPRLDKNPHTVQKYAEDLDILPPIEVNHRNELIDGWHRWTAHKKNDIEEIKVLVTETTSDGHLLELAIERNSSHGLQLSQADKKDMARKIYHVTSEANRSEKKKHLSKILSVSERTVQGWLSRIDKDSKEARNRKIFNLWMACYTQDEIAERCDCHKDTVSEICRKMADLPKSDKPAADHLTDFDVPIYNIWKQQTKSNTSNHFGNTEARWFDNLLYLYTKPFDVVIDPFAGGGSSIDICKKRFRKYWVSDRTPIVEREQDIRTWDVTDGLPPMHRWNDVKLVYLDPPYWKQAEGQYSDSPKDLSNMDLSEFNKALSKTILDFSKKLNDAYIALIIQPTQWRAPDRKYTDHVADMINAVKLPIEMRISCPYESQQCNAQMVEFAKENKTVLVLTREIIVWRI